jgi:MFS family permease
MAEKKEKRVDVQSSSFREIVDGEIICAPEAKKTEEQRRQERVAEAEYRKEKIERNLGNSTAEGIINSAAGSIQNSFMVPFALLLKATSAEIGILASLYNLAGTFSHLPGAMLTKFYSRKTIWTVSQILSRILIWLPVLFLPFINFESRVWLFIALLMISNFFLFIRGPAWSSLMGDIVPTGERGRYFGKRNTYINIAGMAATLAAGFLLAYIGFSGIFAISIILAGIAIFFFARIYEPPMERVFHYHYTFSLKPRDWYNGIIFNRNLVIFTLYLALMNFAMEVAAPFYVVYMIRELQIGYELFAVAVVVGVLARAVTTKHWGTINDRYGSRKILIISGFMACFVPFGWMVVSGIIDIMLVKVYEGVVFAGFELVIFNYLLEITPAKNRPKYIANHNFLNGLGTVGGALFGGFLAFSLEGSSFIFLFGLQIVFLVSFLLRLGCFSILLFTKEADVKQDDIVPVRYVFWQAMAVEPAKEMRRMLSYTFRYPIKIEREVSEGMKNLKYRFRLKMNR